MRLSSTCLFSFEGRTIQGSVLLEGLEGLMEEDPGAAAWPLSEWQEVLYRTFRIDSAFLGMGGGAERRGSDQTRIVDTVPCLYGLRRYWKRDGGCVA